MTSLVLMENAGRGCADVLCVEGIQGRVVIFCGKGNNGGDGLVLGRHLDLRGHDVRLLLWCDPAELSPDAAANYAIALRGGLAIRTAATLSDTQLDAELRSAEWVVDALLGTGVRGAPRAPLTTAIQVMNAAPGRRMSVDVPSGLDAETGQAAQDTVRAHHTCTFVAAKTGFRAAGAAGYLGCLHVLDIGAPRQLIAEIRAAFAGDSV
jgi:NAD(P)H-hydrate epimerase